MTPMTDDELLKLLETAEEAEGPLEYENNVIPFLVRYNIVEGEEKVPSSTLYKLYKAYTKDYVKKPEFSKAVNQILLPHRASGGVIYYLINTSAMRLSKEYYKLISEKEKKVVDRARKYADDFISLYDIKPGNNWIHGEEFYTLYRLKFLKQKVKPRMSKYKFYMMMKLHFDHKKDKGIWFGINEEYKKFISPKEIEKIGKSREAARRKAARKKGKNKQKTNSKIPVSETGFES